MRFMLLVKANEKSEAGALPSHELVVLSLEDAAREQALRDELERRQRDRR
jgi:hypothetical protein